MKWMSQVNTRLNVRNRNENRFFTSFGGFLQNSSGSKRFEKGLLRAQMSSTPSEISIFVTPVLIVLVAVLSFQIFSYLD
jgi:hypothetical protein